MTVFPFIIKRVYAGDAFLLSLMMIIFYGGAAASNFFMMRVMPLRHPGKVYLIMQLSRILILGVMWIQPPFWLMAVASIAWGLNMGVTMTLARAIVQESASEEFLGSDLIRLDYRILRHRECTAASDDDFATAVSLRPAVHRSLSVPVTQLTSVSIARCCHQRLYSASCELCIRL
jgi:hypothetical protein